MDQKAEAVIKKYEKEMAEYPAKMKKYEADLKLFKQQEKSYNRAIKGRIDVVFRIANYDCFDAMVTEKGCRELVAAIEEHNVAVSRPYEPQEPNKPSLNLCVSPGFDNAFPF